MDLLLGAKCNSKHSQTLANDRVGFELTKLNDHGTVQKWEPQTIKFDPKTHNDFDLCFVFPREVSGGSNTIELSKLHEMVDKICRARVGRTLQELNTLGRLHPVYEVDRYMITCHTHQDMVDMFKDIFFRVLDHIGAIYVVEEGWDRYRNYFVRVRLSEPGCQVIADYKKYALQVDMSCVRFNEYKTDSTFVPPYIPYESLTESDEVLKGKYRQLWQRYDRISRPVSEDIKGMSSRRTVHLEASLFRDVDRIRLLRMALFEFLNFDVMVREGLIVQYYVIKQPCVERSLTRAWANFRYIVKFKQPLNLIRNYYGEEVAMYYAWLGYYCELSLLPALVGLIVMILSIEYNRNLSFTNRWVNLMRMGYCVLIGVWSCLFFALWTRREAVLSLRWGVEQDGMSAISQEEAPFFRSSGYVVDPVHPDKFMRSYSPLKRKIRCAITSIITTLTVCLVVVAVNDDLNDWFASYFGWGGTDLMSRATRMIDPSQQASLISSATLIPLLTSISVKVYDYLWSQIAAWRLGEFENHQYFQDYQNSINLKLFLFKIADYLGMLFYLAFFKEHFVPCTDTRDGRCLPMLARQLIMFYSMDLVGDLIEISKPLASFLFKKYWASAKKSMPYYQVQSYLTPYSGVRGLTSDYLNKTIQFGYTSLFSMAVPLLPFLGLVVNMSEMRVDAWKLSHLYQRPFPRQADDIGIWDDLQRAMTFFGILGNVLLCAFTTVGHDRPLTHKLVISLVQSGCSLWLPKFSAFLQVMLLIGLALKDYVEFRFPQQSAKYRLLKARQEVVDYEAIWQAPMLKT